MSRIYPLRSSAKKVSVFSPPGTPEVQIISNIVENGKAIGFADSGIWWHSDQPFTENPEFFVALHAVEVPERNGEPLGDTQFLSTTAAYDALPESMKRRLDGLKAINSYAFMIDKMRDAGLLRRPPLTEEQRAELPDVEHYVVRTHPITGRKLLYVNESHTSHIIGMPKAESDALLTELYAHIAEPRFLYRHRWRKGDLLVWDNCATHHKATFDYGDLRRRMHRVGTDGPRTE